MTFTLAESQTLNEMAGLLYGFLPGSGNARFCFPIAAANADVGDFWIGGSKRPAIFHLLHETFEKRRNRFCALMVFVVRLSMGWRSGKGDPLTVQEIDQLNALLLQLSFKIPELYDVKFRQGLAEKARVQNESKPSIDVKGQDRPDRHAQLSVMLNEVMYIDDPGRRGFAFERFLDEAFALFGLAPRRSFRLVGEQIDGSFHLGNETYLVEAKWQGPQIGNRELQAFAGSVRTKAMWSRGLYISYSGFSEDGLTAFGRGDATRIICLDGLELWQIINEKRDLAEVLSLKTRRAAETGQAYVPVRDLFQAV